MRFGLLCCAMVVVGGAAWGQGSSPALPGPGPGPGQDEGTRLRGIAAWNYGFTGRWSSGDCRFKWYDWTVSGLDISFRSEAGAVDVERVMEVRDGSFVTRTIGANHRPVGAFWLYQVVSPDRIRVQNLSTGNVFFQQRC